MIYLTYNDSPDGVYQSQVIDVCRYWEDTFKERVRLIAFISLRDYFVNKAKIKSLYPDSKVLPMFPGIDNWMLNSFRLNLTMLFRKKQKVIARGVFATLLAHECKRFEKVCFDARGAYEAEWSEYLKSFSPALSAIIKDLEKKAIMQSHFKLAVSNQLVEYWKENYTYSGPNHVVIPCTLPTSLVIKYDLTEATAIRKNLNISKDDVVLVYSGSSAQWQSFNKLEEYISKAFEQNHHLKLLMLCKPGRENTLEKKFPGRVMQTWVKPNEVQSLLQAADYGLLVREPSVTNKVSSPVKFAEYLASGLSVIISASVGDYSSFIKEKNCGTIVDAINWSGLERPSANEKERIQDLAKAYFIKPAYRDKYEKIKLM